MGVTAATVRAMTPADVASVAELEVESFTDPWTPAMFFDELAQPGRAYVVVEDGGRMVAYGGVMLVDRDAHVMTIATRPEHRRRGLATRVLLALFDAALELGAKHLTLEVRASNDAARRMYERFGFVAEGRRRRYYQDGEDAVVMWARDADDPGERGRREALRGRG